MPGEDPPALGGEEEWDVQAMTRLVELAEGNTAELLLVLAVVTLLLGVVLVGMSARVGRLSRAYARLTAGTGGGSVEQVLHEHLDRVGDARARAEQAETLCREMEARLRTCVQRVGVVRFDAFPDVGGRLSFALAMLDDAGNGLLLTSLHSGQETRLYAKPMREGRSEAPLTEEEAEALRQAGFETEASRMVRLPDMGRAPRK